MALVIRPAEARDGDALAEQFLALNRYEAPLTGDRWTAPESGPAARDACWARARETGGHVLVAELDGAVVGHLFLWFETDAPYIAPDKRRRAHIADLFVREAHRSAGIGARLMAEAERLAREAGLSRLTLGVVRGNDRAQALYERAGFRPYLVEMLKEWPA